MSDQMTRRQAIGTGAALTGLFAATSCNAPNKEPVTGDVGIKDSWMPGPDKNVVRDLTPGQMTIRLGTGMGRGKNESLTEMVKRIRDGGFTGTVTGAEPWNSMKDSELSELRAALKEYDVVVYEISGYKNMLHPDNATRQKALKDLALCIEAADKVNCPMVGTCTGSRDPNSYIGVHPDNWTKETWKLTIESVKQVLRDTAGMKAALGIEAQVTMNVDGPKSHRKLMDDVGDPRCAVNLDPVNMIHLHNYYHTTELLHECFDLLGENILGCHSKDTYIWPDKQTVHVQEVCSGRGVMDYETYLVLMSKLKWPRTLLPEHVPADQIIEAGKYIRKVAAKVGVKMHG